VRGVNPPRLFHYTDDDGYKSISARPDWVFKVAQPPGKHPPGAYFTSLGPGTRNLALRLRIPKDKLRFVFCFTEAGDLHALRGERGNVIFFSRVDYVVECARQVFMGSRESAMEHLK
jgi:hypothetical protein